tara:strand:+ start:294 stop:512 length:219 start_codon:yes stop_codon:yes gene_type:complete
MCLGGGNRVVYEDPKPIKQPAPGPPSPDDMLNNQVIENINPRSKQKEARESVYSSDTKQKLKLQSDKSNIAY